MPRKRARDETAAAATGAPAGDPTDASRSAIELEHDDDNSTKLQKLRNTWEFACLVQFLFLFGKTLKLQNVDLDVCFAICAVLFIMYTLSAVSHSADGYKMSLPTLSTCF